MKIIFPNRIFFFFIRILPGSQDLSYLFAICICPFTARKDQRIVIGQMKQDYSVFAHEGLLQGIPLLMDCLVVVLLKRKVRD